MREANSGIENIFKKRDYKHFLSIEFGSWSQTNQIYVSSTAEVVWHRMKRGDDCE
jgi:hypothetical protein